MLFTFKNYNTDSQDRISALWNMMKMIREFDETPELWKLTDPFLDAVVSFMKLEPKNKIFEVTFLDTSIDVTSTDSVLICTGATYPVSLIAPNIV